MPLSPEESKQETEAQTVIVAVQVGVALTRPPRTDRYSRILVHADIDPANPDWFAAETEARLTACHIAHRPDVVMVVSAVITDLLDV